MRPAPYDDFVDRDFAFARLAARIVDLVGGAALDGRVPRGIRS